MTNNEIRVEDRNSRLDIFFFMFSLNEKHNEIFDIENSKQQQ